MLKLAKRRQLSSKMDLRSGVNIGLRRYEFNTSSNKKLEVINRLPTLSDLLMSLDTVWRLRLLCLRF
jgi:hypothetical protein